MVSPLRLERFLREHTLVGIDSNVLIYFIEAHSQYHRATSAIFQSIEAGRNRGVCSTLALMEVLVQPYRMHNDELVNRFYGLLTTYPHLTWVDLSIAVADVAARLRADYRLKTPDSILLATTLHAGATGFIGNDAGLKRVPEVDVLVLSEGE
ncbi:MAG: PIN domain-containing protein [Nitrospirota bacterium]